MTMCRQKQLILVEVEVLMNEHGYLIANPIDIYYLSIITSNVCALIVPPFSVVFG